jgi:hypothetical protein
LTPSLDPDPPQLNSVRAATGSTTRTRAARLLVDATDKTDEQLLATLLEVKARKVVTLALLALKKCPAADKELRQALEQERTAAALAEQEGKDL